MYGKVEYGLDFGNSVTKNWYEKKNICLVSAERADHKEASKVRETRMGRRGGVRGKKIVAHMAA